MEIISIRENSLTVEIITEMIFNKKARLYKTTKDFEIYEIKNTDIKIALISQDVKYFKNKEIEYNTQIFYQLYQGDNLNTKSIIQLYNLNVFM